MGHVNSAPNERQNVQNIW